MQMTALNALEILASGDVARAWQVAQQDDGLNKGVTFSQWLGWATDRLAARAGKEG